MSDELRQTLINLQQRGQDAARSLQAVRAQLNARERDKKLTTLTLREIEQLPRDPNQANCYRAVGRMFVQESRNNVENTLRAKMKEATDEVSILEKKAKYLDGEITTAQNSIRDILQEQAASS
ncbi:prefolding complex chaperone subunit [Rhodotorula paludigena]|uniref:Prefoldin subunit 1 n=1 Tax=Rhodotorula paludigena TaxID=86838 RepID=A0AAV5G9T7_9BASI|nr:hypothetical protein Rhopal_000134-T1 [Rhodotorula paludigena]